jgi:mono/diheme cytochrome c family protein
MRFKLQFILVGAAAAGIAACTTETPEERRASLQAARADSVLLAEAEYDISVFDTIVWPSPEGRLERGGVVWRFSCEKCHGTRGRGDGELAKETKLEMPSVVASNWEYAGDVDGVRHRVFVGHEGAMPNWGLHGLKYRDVDAVAYHILVTMRRDSLKGSS